MNSLYFIVALFSCLGLVGAQDEPTVTGSIEDNRVGATFQPMSPNGASKELNLTRPVVKAINSLPRICPCDNTPSQIDTSQIRALSDRWGDGGDDADNTRMSNFVWAWGQFIDHDIVGTIDDEKSERFTIKVADDKNMNLRRVRASEATREQQCRRPRNIHTGKVDGGAVYGTDRMHELRTLRDGASCYLRASSEKWLPITTEADDKGKFHFLAGDIRVDEHAVLTSIHTLFLREHNRLCDAMETMESTKNKNAWDKYQIAKRIVIAKIQQITVNEWLPVLAGISKTDLKKAAGKIRAPHVSVEFSLLFRLGHTLIPNQIGSRKVQDLFDGQKFFLDPVQDGVAVKSRAEEDLKSIMRDLRSRAASLDSKVSSALRNMLFGPSFGEDLWSRNIFRTLDLALPSYASLAKCFGTAHDEQIQRDTPNGWIGALRECKDNKLGPLLRAAMLEQFHRIFFGPRGYWWYTAFRWRAEYFMGEIEETTLAKVIRDNTGVDLGGNVFMP